MKKFGVILLAAAMCLGLAGCGSKADDKKADSEKVYAVEAGSAGEEAANEKGYKTNAVNSQADALMEVQAGTSDAAIIDLLMAGAMIGEGTSYPDLIHTDELTTSIFFEFNSISFVSQSITTNLTSTPSFSATSLAISASNPIHSPFSS